MVANVPICNNLAGKITKRVSFRIVIPKTTIPDKLFGKLDSTNSSLWKYQKSCLSLKDDDVSKISWFSKGIIRKISATFQGRKKKWKMRSHLKKGVIPPLFSHLFQLCFKKKNGSVGPIFSVSHRWYFMT